MTGKVKEKSWNFTGQKVWKPCTFFFTGFYTFCMFLHANFVHNDYKLDF